MKASILWTIGLAFVAAIVLISNQDTADVSARTTTNCGGHAMQDNYGNWVCQPGMSCPKGSNCKQNKQWDSKTNSWEDFCGCVPSPTPAPGKRK